MPISTLRDEVQTTLVEFAWSQWAQMGVFASTDRRDAWAQDPEALLVFTLHVARREPRLFDEVLDWLRLNGRLVTGRRLASLCPHGDADRQLVEAAVDWARANGSTVQIADRHLTKTSEEELFASVRVAKPDQVFRSHGYLKPATEPSFNSREPDLRAPINLAFRLRQHFGLASSRAEIVRFLLTSGVPDANALAIADAAGYAKRNVNETLAALVATGDVERYMRGNEGRYSVDRARWAHFLGIAPDEIPAYRDWPRLLLALRELDRWLDDSRLADLSDYMRASEARALMERLQPTLTAAGVLVSRDGAGADYWPTFEQNISRLLEKLRPTAPAQSKAHRHNRDVSARGNDLRIAVITNERQYRIAKSQARKFEQAIAAARETETPEVHPRVHGAMTEALESELAILRDQIDHYEALKASKVKRRKITSERPGR